MKAAVHHLLKCRGALLILLAATVFSHPVFAQNSDAPATERIHWNKAPIRLTLPVGIERRVSFPGAVQVGVPPELVGQLRTQSVDGTVYWLAGEPFEPTRIQVQEIDTGRIYLFDLQARKDRGSPAPVEVLVPRDTPDTAKDSTKPLTGTDRPSYVTLTRFAAQQMYAPKRLLRDLPGIYRAPLRVTGPIPLLRGGTVEAVPLASWRGGDLHVTAVRLRNLTNRPLIVDPRDLRGTWLTAAFQHARLLPVGDEADTTCVYVISARPFEESL